MYELLSTVNWPTWLMVILVICMFWYLFLTDRDIQLALAENFGRSTGYYQSKVVWVSGASSGLGESMAYELASVGAKLILSARTECQLQNVKEACLHKSNGKLREEDILILPFDITELHLHQKYVDNALAHFKKIDIFIDNVGCYQIGNVHNTSMEVMKDIFDINFFGGVHLTKILLKHFLERKQGHIIVVASMGGKIGLPLAALYCATKCALQGFYDALRVEYNKDNICVTVVHPGLFMSNAKNQVLGTSKGEILPTIKYFLRDMSSERCAHLTLTAGANCLFEAWISHQPGLLGLWFARHFPDIFRLGSNLYFTRRRLKCMMNGIVPSDLIMWPPIFGKK